MEKFINKVELQGVIGSVKYCTMAPDMKKCYKFSLATNRCYKNKDGMPVIETQWYNVTIWEKAPEELNWLEKGKWIHLTGYVSIQKYIGADGIERCVCEIKADDILTIVEE